MENLNLKVRTVVEILVLPILIYGVGKIDSMATNLQELNTKVAVILSKEPATTKKIEQLEDRILELEKKVK